MNFYSMTDKAVAAEIGQRIEQMRLECNLTQQAVAEEVGMTPKSYRQLIQGGGKFTNLIAVLRVLERLDLVENFVPESSFSPMAQLKLRGRQRQRARGQGTLERNSIEAPLAPGTNKNDLDW